MKVVFSENAERDLEHIADWIARDNPDRARSFVADLVKTCKSIGRAPRSYRWWTKVEIQLCDGESMAAI